jgi:hypothetical protein
MTSTRRRRRWTKVFILLRNIPIEPTTVYPAYVIDIPSTISPSSQCLVAKDRRLTDVQCINFPPGRADSPRFVAFPSMKSLIFSIAALVPCICRVLAGQTYSKSLDITGTGFYDEFRFDNSADPTHGRVYASPPPSCQLIRPIFPTSLSSVNTSIGRPRRSSTSPMPLLTLSFCAPTTQRISCRPILAENQSASSLTNSSQPLSQCMSAELFVRLFIIIYL